MLDAVQHCRNRVKRDKGNRCAVGQHSHNRSGWLEPEIDTVPVIADYGHQPPTLLAGAPPLCVPAISFLINGVETLPPVITCPLSKLDSAGAPDAVYAGTVFATTPVLTAVAFVLSTTAAVSLAFVMVAVSWDATVAADVVASAVRK